MDALGLFNDVPHIGISMLKLGSDAVTVSAEPPVVVFSVGERPPANSIGATAFFSAVDGRGSPLQVGEVLLITLLTKQSLIIHVRAPAFASVRKDCMVIA